MGEYKELKSLDQIKDGDKVATTFKGKREYWDHVNVLDPNTDMEEILLDPENNIYFITSMAIGGVSWAQDVVVLSRSKVTAE